MPRPIRIERPELAVSFTVRCREGRRLLTPVDAVGEILLYRLARAVRDHGIELFGFVQMSNHLHGLVRAPRGNMSAFMRDFLGLSARDINKLLGRRGDGVFRRHTQVHVLDDAATLERLSYLLANPALAHLVDEIDDWPGLSSAPALLHGERMIGRRFDEARWRRARCPDERAPFTDEIELVHARLPGREHLTDDEHRRVVRDVVEAREAEARAERARPLPRRAWLLAADPDTIPKRMKEQPCPPCHAKCVERRRQYTSERKATRDAYVVASLRWRSGELEVSFPEGTYRPWLDRAALRLAA